MNPSILNLGCGEDYVEGATNVDFYAERTDVRHDLNCAPYPFLDDSFDIIRCMNVIEHLDDVFQTMAEIHRIGKPGGLVEIRVPHFRSACLYEDITHKRGFAWRTLDVFCEKGTIYGNYSSTLFAIESRRYTPYKLRWLYDMLSKAPMLTDNLLSKYIPMASIYFRLRIIK